MARVYVLYRDIRTYGFREKYYKMARDAGIVFIRYDEEKPPPNMSLNSSMLTRAPPGKPPY